jgi:hypothetical protein
MNGNWTSGRRVFGLHEVFGHRAGNVRDIVLEGDQAADSQVVTEDHGEQEGGGADVVRHHLGII